MPTTDPALAARKPFQPRNLPKLAARLTSVGLDHVGTELATTHGDAIWTNPLVVHFLLHRLPELQERYRGLNPGQVRMNLGNLIRGAIKRELAAQPDAN